jgi:predicted nucleic acid-binding protein
MKCLDTDLLVAVLRGNPEAEEKIRELDSEGRHATTSVNCFELFYGAYRSREKRSNVAGVESLLQRLDLLPFELEASQKAGEALAALSAGGEVVDFRDAMVAAVAESKSLTLVSRNKEHFSRFRGLKLELW